MPNNINPSVITGEMPKMPQITSGATTQSGGIDLSTLDPSIYNSGIGFGSSSNSGFNWSNVWNAINGFVGSPLGQGIGAIGTSIINNLFDNYRAKQQRQWNEEMMDKQNAFSLDMWNKTNEYNTPANQKQRMVDAGMNPLYYGLDGSSANSFESAQPLSYERSTMPLLSNPFPGMLDAQVKQAQIDNINADTTKKLADTDQTYLENEYLQKTMDARVKGVELANELTKSEIKKIEEQIPEIRQHIELMSKQADTELAKQFWYAMDSALKGAEIKKIITLLPLEVELTKARTAHERAAASLAFVEASYKQKLIDGGYITAMIDEMKARARKAGADADIAESSVALEKKLNDLKQGKDDNKISQWFVEHPNMKATHPALAFLSGDMWRIFNNMKETGVFDFLSIIGAAKFLSSRPGNKTIIENKTSYPTMYGSNGEPVSWSTTRNSSW